MQVTCESKIYSDNIKKAKAKRKSAKELKKGVGSTRERERERERESCWGDVSKRIQPEKLLHPPCKSCTFKRIQLEHSSHIVKVGVKATC